ncbi:MAG: hypothetical protein HYR96_06745 [Deltaproteobacteria bacterium]|nr:hypothetical protein [Deltaproteobacteria bacterium]MBI3296440.1 hypothetical protein [Deltaproteobacteria bacterium]
MRLSLFLFLISIVASQFFATDAMAGRHGGRLVVRTRSVYRTYDDGCCSYTRVRTRTKIRWRMRGGYAIGYRPCYNNCMAYVAAPQFNHCHWGRGCGSGFFRASVRGTFHTGPNCGCGGQQGGYHGGATPTLVNPRRPVNPTRVFSFPTHTAPRQF